MQIMATCSKTVLLDYNLFNLSCGTLGHLPLSGLITTGKPYFFTTSCTCSKLAAMPIVDELYWLQPLCMYVGVGVRVLLKKQLVAAKASG